MDLFQIAIFAVAVLSSGIASVTGFGIGSLLTPLLALEMELKLAVALVSIPHFVATAIRCYMLRQYIDKSILLNFGIASAAGGLTGALFHNVSQDPILAYLFSGLLILAGLLGTLGLSEKFVVPKALSPLAGFISGAFGGMVGNQGGIRAAALLGFNLSKETFVATATVTGVIVDFARLPVYAIAQGPALLDKFPVICSMTVACILGTYLGKITLTKIPDQIFRRVVGAIIFLLGVYMFCKVRFAW